MEIEPKVDTLYDLQLENKLYYTVIIEKGIVVISLEYKYQV